ncbi:uncharacterized protein VTP21DRAFT_11182 [Calcarisporiella thermophila]|uniref:uncharacterized protein n=1 Tax=Calcarisporiella thermophila TaxID=911321 RepID=UPI003742A6E3
MACKLDPGVHDAYARIRSDGPTNWILMGYNGTRDSISLYSSGTGGLAEFRAQLRDDEVQYGFLRVKDRCLFVTYMTEKISGVKKARALVHTRTLGSRLPEYDYHLTATHILDLSDNMIRQRLRLPSLEEDASTDLNTPPVSPHGIKSNSELTSSPIHATAPSLTDPIVHTTSAVAPGTESPESLVEEDEMMKGVENWALGGEGILGTLSPRRRKAAKKLDEEGGTNVEPEAREEVEAKASLNTANEAEEKYIKQEPPHVATESVIPIIKEPAKSSVGMDLPDEEEIEIRKKGKEKEVEKVVKPEVEEKSNNPFRTNAKSNSSTPSLKTPIFTGFITIQTENIWVWRRRWCTLRGNVLEVFKSVEDATPIAVLDFSNNLLIHDAKDEIVLPNSFKVETPDGSHYLFTDTSEERAIVLDAISKHSLY